ncbi:hypothetical protein [Bacillus sp. ISL-37]|uniref:hypothetical protein n=1 Tax=Bacillus sp. ISL-37 TaxID=2819123 RepID=UPI001BEAA76C|nr:hypothetical protein [Bacillus sp. ISL-37]
MLDRPLEGPAFFIVSRDEREEAKSCQETILILTGFVEKVLKLSGIHHNHDRFRGEEAKAVNKAA